MTLMTTNGQAPFVTEYMYLSEVEEGQASQEADRGQWGQRGRALSALWSGVGKGGVVGWGTSVLPSARPARLPAWLSPSIPS